MSSLDPCYILRGLSGSVTSLSTFERAEHSHVTSGLVSGFSNGCVKIWDLGIRRSTEEITSHNGKSILKVSLSQNGFLLTHGRNGAITIWKSNNDGCHTQMKNFSCSDLTFCSCAILWKEDCSQDFTIACPSKDNEKTKISVIKLKDNVSELSSVVIPKNKGMLMHLCWYDDDSNRFLKLLIGHEDGSVGLWDISSGKECASVKCFDDPVMCLDVDQSGHVAVGSSGNTLKTSSIVIHQGVVSFTKCIETTTKHHGNASLRIRRDQRILAAGGWDGRIRIFGFKKMTLLAVLKYHTETINCLDFTSDGYLMAGCKDGKISVWNVYRGRMEDQRNLNGMMVLD